MAITAPGLYPKKTAKITKIPSRVPFRPLYNCVLIEPETNTLRQDSDGDIIKIPDALKKKPMTGIVLAVGSGRPLDIGKDLPLKTKVGDRVVFDRYGSLPFMFDKRELYIAQETQIFGIIEDDTVVTSVISDAKIVK